MDDTITTIYCMCEEFAKAMGLRDDPKPWRRPPRCLNVYMDKQKNE